MGERIGLDCIEGITISTLRPNAFAWYGRYETAICIDGGNWGILEGYNTEEEAVEGHNKYSSMTREELENLPTID